jgi:hypothetical protein
MKKAAFAPHAGAKRFSSMTGSGAKGTSMRCRPHVLQEEGLDARYEHLSCLTGGTIADDQG